MMTTIRIWLYKSAEEVLGFVGGAGTAVIGLSLNDVFITIVAAFITGVFGALGAHLAKRLLKKI